MDHPQNGNLSYNYRTIWINEIFKLTNQRWKEKRKLTQVCLVCITVNVDKKNNDAENSSHCNEITAELEYHSCCRTKASYKEKRRTKNKYIGKSKAKKEPAT